MSNLHRVFVSFHHANDEHYKTLFVRLFSDHAEAIVDHSVGQGDIDPNTQTETIRQRVRDEYLRNTSVTIVLIGTETWKRKHVDWEISSSLRASKINKRSGLVGILLPTRTDFGTRKYDAHTIPPRLYDNARIDYAAIYDWTNSPESIRKWVDEAFLRKDRINPDNSRDLFRNNRSGDRWE